MAGARKDENGTVVYKVSDKEVNFGFEPADLQKEFEIRNNLEAIDFGDAEGTDLRVLFLEEMQKDEAIDENRWNEIIDKELSIFKEGEKYDYVRDMRSAYAPALEKSLYDKIFETLPDHVFWDIKTPINQELDHHVHRYNPARPLAETSFFQMRKYEAYLLERSVKSNIGRDISMYKST